MPWSFHLPVRKTQKQHQHQPVCQPVRQLSIKGTHPPREAQRARLQSFSGNPHVLSPSDAATHWVFVSLSPFLSLSLSLYLSDSFSHCPGFHEPLDLQGVLSLCLCLCYSFTFVYFCLHLCLSVSMHLFFFPSLSSFPPLHGLPPSMYHSDVLDEKWPP